MPNYTSSNATNPLRILVKPNSSSEVVATFTYGCHTVHMRGPARTFEESDPLGNSGVSVTHQTWVRSLPTPFAEAVDEAWLDAALIANQARLPDILSIAMQYIDGAPTLLTDTGEKFAGQAEYGPLIDGHRQEGSDFNDYLGIPWVYGDANEDRPESTQINCLDCSGFVRMVYGFRDSFEGHNGKIPLSLSIQPDCSAIPRRAWQISIGSPGVMLVSNQRAQVTNLASIKPGDLVFFDADDGDGSAIDHVGIFLGADSEGNKRFVSSRKILNGPTFRDGGGQSVLNGLGHYAKSFRAARRL